MKYKIYCNNKEYKVPSATVYGYGDVIKAPWGEDVAIRLGDGDILYLKKDYYEGNEDEPVLYTSTESGYVHSVFYICESEDRVYQSASGGLGYSNILQHNGDYVRVYKFGEIDDFYDAGLGEYFYDEEECRRHGHLVAILQFTTDANGDEVGRFLDPNIVKYNGQGVELPQMNDRLFISSLAETSDGEGYYYVFASGNEGLGLIVDRSDSSVRCESYEGGFGGHYPNEDFDLYIYHCGTGLYDLMDDQESGYPDDFYDFESVNSFFQTYNIEPTILRYNEDTELGYLVQEGTRYDY